MAKKKKNLGKIGVIIIAILLLGSTLAIGLQSLGGSSDPSIVEGKEKIKFEGYTFYYDAIEDTYSIFANIQNNQIQYINDLSKELTSNTARFAFREDPRNLTDIEISEETVNTILNSNKIYLSYSPNSENVSKVVVAAMQVGRLTGNVYQIQTVESYTEDDDPINPDVPLRTCEDSTNTTTIVTFEISDNTGVYSEENCVFIRGTNADELIKSADKLGMHLIGIEI